MIPSFPLARRVVPAAPPKRRGRLGRWLARAALGLGVFLAICGALFAIPPSREFLIDQIIYQGDFFFPTSQPRTVTRLVYRGHGRPPLSMVVPVRSGTIASGRFASRALRWQIRTYKIYLPPGYTLPANRRRRYPVLYLVHGSPGNPGSWIRGAHADFVANEEIAAGTVRPLIMVMPDVNGGRWRDTECVNKWDGSDREMDYFTRDLLPWIDAHYRTIPARADRAIGGLSSGGYCAFNIALQHPRLFGTAFSISGYFHALRGEVFGLNDPFGHDPRFIAANSPDAYVARVRSVRAMHLFIADSTADYGYTGYAERFERELRRLKIPHTLLMHHPSGFHLWDHSWAFWHSSFRQLLPLVSAGFGH